MQWYIFQRNKVLLIDSLGLNVRIGYLYQCQCTSVPEICSALVCTSQIYEKKQDNDKEGNLR